MSGEDIGDGSSGTGSVNRRRVLKGLAAAGGVTTFGTMGVSASSSELETKAVSQAEAERVFASQAAGVLKTLSSEGLLAEASLDELPTQQTTTDPRKPGVTHEVSGGGEIYVARQQTSEGTLAVLVRPSSGEAIGVHSTSDGYTVYDAEGITTAESKCSGCQDTEACPTPVGIPDHQGLFCFGTFISCCG
ncbi:twin-arginine translocation signal domain-containing protein [Halogeometricum borinquense]|uniref:Twin-arginine translocation signal domain-containing protein n=1 Tax=Halogeometricum borinquense TaxID=60847 RepID=A0A482TJX8_9EURY|nr:twin-arginine translocation signal domain-containing protein [Halogeometricum borinquense]RYJ14293.1 twin-arginine translocation signal domain-containing protein [Halogeometricum borinquense]